ncbi:tRNA1(Val) (adenine(37)-N6)-methyltransferase [Flavihumibacter sp. ZG627]|uniref:tRNA1(Val) (adenine(37)-N6)-methyltransferase n=1 Tax=Flavihumibacter sp. ZG627 TaxID=1463156 RepID=UPI0005806BBB|nr:methyltransferase [Flavihumibacter sp. ZG627]KIC91766.1 hypothetical protein HY58_06000 [Flavihumibacter sp. ZG627]
MANTYFQFKQFTVHQERTAMKVCTDACVFGAWVAAKMDLHIPKSMAQNNNGELLTESTMVLDIGTGTGLLSLMLAQQLSLRVDAVEMDKDAYEQSAGNFKDSLWAARLSAVHGDIRLFSSTAVKYDIIISNPPFFENDLKASGRGRNLARHESLLDLRELFRIAASLLAPEGYFALLLPAHRKVQAEQLAAESGMHPCYIADIHQSMKHSAFRVMFIFSDRASTAFVEKINIRNGDHYSPEFVQLLQPYYLHL